MATLAHPLVRPPAAAEAPALRHVGPAWYATVMGTAVVASAGAALPLRIPGLRTAATAVWALSVVLLAAVLAARATRWARHHDAARADLLDPAVAPFYGCLPMALLAVGGATLAVGGDVLGQRAAVLVDGVLFGAGTVLGLAVAVTLPYLMVVRHRPTLADVSPVWLLPVVPPLVAAGAGAGLVPHLPAGQGREALLLGCYAMFGLSLLATLALLPLIVGRLTLHGPLPLALTPAVFLVLGPLGQSTTAVGRLADAAPTAVGGTLAPALGAFAVVYGVPVMGFALLWLALSAASVVRALRRGMPFSLGWWAFTFPVGTCVTGAEALAHRTGLVAFQWLAAGLFAPLVSAWVTVFAGTVRGLTGGALPAGPPAPRPGTARTR